MVQLQLGDFSTALSDAEETIRLDSNWPKGYYRKAQALERLGRYSEASHSMEEAIRRTDGKKAKQPMQQDLLILQEKAGVDDLLKPSPTDGVDEKEENAGSILTELMAKTICLTELPDEGSVREFCGQFGTVLGATMFKSWFVTFDAVDAADNAICMGLSAAVPGKEIVVTLQSSSKSWDATLQITAAAQVEKKRAKQLAAHLARMAVLASGPTISSEEEDEEEKQAQQSDKETGEEEAVKRRATTDFDLLIIGAGASGVGCGVMAKKFGIDPKRTMIIERGNAVGSTFEQWPKEMRFITPSFNQQAFGMMDLNSVAYDTSPAQMFHEEHPTGQMYAQYLRVVAHTHRLPVAVHTNVTAVTPVFHPDGDYFDVSVTQTPEASCQLPPQIRAGYVVWAAGEFQYPSMDAFPGSSEHCVHNSSIRNWAKLAESNDQLVVIGGYESGIDATVHLANAGCDVTVLASTPFWSIRTLDPCTELAP